MQTYTKKTYTPKIVILILFLITISASINTGFAQVNLGQDMPELDYSKPHKYEIGGIKVEGTEYLA